MNRKTKNDISRSNKKNHISIREVKESLTSGKVERRKRIHVSQL